MTLIALFCLKKKQFYAKGAEMKKRNKEIYKGLTCSWSDTNKCTVVWNGDGDALAGFYGGYADDGDYIDGLIEAERFIDFHNALTDTNVAQRDDDTHVAIKKEDLKELSGYLAYLSIIPDTRLRSLVEDIIWQYEEYVRGKK